MPQALSSFLISVSCIVAVALLVPCIESIAKLLRRRTLRPSDSIKGDQVKAYSREIA